MKILRFTVPLLLGFPLSAATHTVNVGPGFAFNPPSQTINAGDTVRWNFLEPNHTTTSDAQTGPEVWDSGVVAPGGSFSHTFTTVGNHPYYCAVHSFPGGTFMNGVIRVVTPPPVSITAVDPMSAAPGTRVVITGVNFEAGAAVRFGGVPATDVLVRSSTVIEATVPVIPPGPAPITVTNPSGASATFNGFVALDVTMIPLFQPWLLALVAVALGILGWAGIRR